MEDEDNMSADGDQQRAAQAINNNNNINNDFDDDVGSVSLCALFASEKQIGISHYSDLSNCLQVERLDCTADTLADILQCVKIACAPTLFLVHPHFYANPSYMDILQAGCDGTAGVYAFKVIKSSQWSVEAAKATLIKKVRLTNEGPIVDTEWRAHTRLMQWSAVIDMDSAVLLKSLSVLLSHIQENCFQLEDGIISLVAVKQMQDIMRIDAASFKALHIFTEEFHPNVIKSKGRSKEGYSLYSLFDRTKSTPGSLTLKSWMLRPFYSINSIIHRQDGIALTIRSDNREYILEVSKLLRRISSIPKILLKIKKVSATFNEWIKLYRTLNTAMSILDSTSYFMQSSSNASDAEYINNIFISTDFSSIQTVYNSIVSVIDFQATETNKSIVICQGYNLILDEMRAVFDALPTELNTAALLILDQCPLLQNVTVEYMPQFGYMAGIDKFENMFIDSSMFEFKYENEGKYYYKCGVVEALDERIGDIKNNILDFQRQLIVELEEVVLDKELLLNSLSYALGELDALIALGEVAIEREYVRPEIVEDNIIIIKGGRHPLQEMTSADSFIANDTCILEDKNIALITGANGSGKTVYMKQVGLLVYMAHIGSYLPCERAIIGLTDRIMTRISSTETVASNQSSFTLDLNQISSMLSSHTERSLCLIDEFGKGTSPIDGISLLSVTIAHFATHVAKAFFVLHFTEAIDSDIFPPEAMAHITLFNMACHDQENYSEGESLSMPLYKLKLGMATSSQGIPCARLAGLSPSVLHRAVEIKGSIVNGTIVKALDAMRLQVVQEGLRGEVLKQLLTCDWSAASEEHIQGFKALLQRM